MCGSGMSFCDGGMTGCSNGINSVVLLICFSKVMVSLMGTYS